MNFLCDSSIKTVGRSENPGRGVSSISRSFEGKFFTSIPVKILGGNCPTPRPQGPTALETDLDRRDEHAVGTLRKALCA